MLLRRAGLLLPLVLSSALLIAAQQLPAVRITVTIAGRPIPHHALLISDNPTTAAPRRTMTDTSGVAEIHLRPGNYTIESETPIVVGGRQYEWAQEVTVGAGAGTALALTEANALVEDATASTTSDSAVVMQRQDSVFGVWSATAHGSGFLADANGLVLTSQAVVGAAEDVQVELTPALTVAGKVLAADAAKNVAVIAIAPAAVRDLKPIPIGAAAQTGDDVVAIGVPMLAARLATSGTVENAGAHAMTVSAAIDSSATGGPLLSMRGDAVGLATRDEDGDAGAVPIADAAGVLADARGRLPQAAGLSPSPLATDPSKRLPRAVLEQAVRPRAGSLSAYRVAFDDFDVSFVTPLMTFGVEFAAERAGAPAGARETGAPPEALRALEKFENWQDYVDLHLPVLMIRATPKFVEGLWPFLGRQAARTQGVKLPPLTHAKVPFGSLTFSCGDEIRQPIHDLKIEQRLPAKDGTLDTIVEGLSVYAPSAAGADCRAPRITVRAATPGARPEVRPVDPRILDQIHADFVALGISSGREER
jgi:S1-C subfamily serine protease